MIERSQSIPMECGPDGRVVGRMSARAPVALRWPAATAAVYAATFVLVYYVSVRTVRGRLVLRISPGCDLQRRIGPGHRRSDP
jgi:hypothetical protein